MGNALNLEQRESLGAILNRQRRQYESLKQDAAALKQDVAELRKQVKQVKQVEGAGQPDNKSEDGLGLLEGLLLAMAKMAMLEVRQRRFGRWLSIHFGPQRFRTSGHVRSQLKRRSWRQLWGLERT